MYLEWAGQQAADSKRPVATTMLRMAFVSSTTFASAGAIKQVKDMHCRWSRMAAFHARDPFHVVLAGRDPVCADQIRQLCPAIAKRVEPRSPGGSGNSTGD